MVFCEDDEGIVERMNVKEIKLPVNGGVGGKDLTLRIILGNITSDIPKNPLCKEKIHQIEMVTIEQLLPEMQVHRVLKSLIDFQLVAKSVKIKEREVGAMSTT